MLAGPPGSDIVEVTPLFREIHVNRSGQVLFASSYQDQKTGAFNPVGFFLLTDGGVRPAVLPGQVAPLTGGPVYTSLSSPRLDDGGGITFAATVAGAGRKPRAGLFRWTTAGAMTLAAAGDPVPGWDGESYRAVSDPASNATGGVAFLALLDPPPVTGSSAAVLAAAGGTTLSALVDGGSVDLDSGTSFRVDDHFPPAPLALQDDGTLLVAASLRGGAAPDGLFLVQPG
jgi:hypothetical protein